MNDVSNKVKEILNPKIERYLNYHVEDLKKLLDIKSNAKNLNSMIISKIIDLKDLDLDNLLLLKKYTVFKTVTLNDKDKVVESMSFPAINFYDIHLNEWSNSEVFKYFSTKIIVIFIFKKELNDSKFMGVKFLKLSDSELSQLGEVWNHVKELVNNNLLKIGGLHGYSVMNFPKKEENPIAHVRPKDQNSAKGRVLLPNGKYIMNYCFWLNNNFIDLKIKE